MDSLFWILGYNPLILFVRHFMETSLPAARAQNGKLAKTSAYYIAFVALGLTVAVVGPTLSNLARATGTTTAQIGIIFTTTSLGYLLGSLFGGRLYDRLPGHRVQAAGLLVMAAMIALLPVLPSLWLLAALMVVLGFGQGTLDVGANTLIVWVHGDKVGPFMNGLHFFFGVGTFLAPILVAQVLRLTGAFGWSYWIIALLLLPLAAWLLRLPSPQIQTGQRDGQTTGQVRAGILVLLMLFFFMAVGAEGSFGSWASTYVLGQHLGDEVKAAYLTSAFWGAYTAARLLSIPLAAWLHPRWILLGDLALCLLGLGTVLLWPLSFPAVLASAIIFGLGIASVFPTTLLLAGRYLPINGRITGFFFVGGSIGHMLFPWLIGRLIGSAGPLAIMWAIAAASLLALIVLFALLIGFRRNSD